jgi:transposase InsO family protein
MPASANKVWVWDITNLRSYTAGFFYKLFLFEDLYSRKIVGWDVLETCCDGDAIPILNKALVEEGITGEQLRVHSDNGTPMRGVNMLSTLLGMGIRPSFSRPNVSNDNAHVEALFRTMKYAPMYPTKPFASLSSARSWVDAFVHWYNSSMHSSLNYVTPNQRHAGQDKEILTKRRKVYIDAWKRNPIRWARTPRTWDQPKLAKLNPYGTRMVN